MKESRILLLIPNLGRGGAQQVFRDQLGFYTQNFNALGCVFNFDDSFQDDEKLNIVSLNVPSGKSFLGKIICFFNRVRAVRNIKKQQNITVSISHLEGADYVNLFSKRKEKTICWIHGTKAFDENIEGFLGMIRKKILIPLTYKRSDQIVTVSEGIRQELIQTFAVPSSKIATIYNSFDLEMIFKKALVEISSDYQRLFGEKQVLITHCRLSRQKNLFVLIDIFNKIKNNPAIKLLILGDGELRNDLLEHCKNLGLRIFTVWDQHQDFNLDYDVYFLGYERNPYPFLHMAALYLMTSSWEGFPLSLCEAIASGVPIMSSDCYTGPREIISPELKAKQPIDDPLFAPYGILMPLASGESLKIWKDTIMAALQNPSLRKELIKNGKERVSAFDRNLISTQWLQIIKQ
jgi:glycosyltransferase involved in cell wall biosynthesis